MEKFFRSLVGCLLHMIETRPNLMFAASLLSRFMVSPSELHYKNAKRVMRYIKGSKNLGICSRKVGVQG